jgi:uncharacterized protein (TIGR02246 family)
MSDHRAHEQAIRDIENRAREAAAAKDLDRYVSCYADDAVLFWPGVPMVTGQAAIRAFMERFLAAPGFSLQFRTARVGVSSDAALAYSYGTNAVSFPGPGGSLLHDKGKYVSVYRKGPDGVWKVVADIGKADLPAPSTESV